MTTDTLTVGGSDSVGGWVILIVLLVILFGFAVRSYRKHRWTS